jgi:glycosyltransferase involved in cell wall biosynthesis
MDKKKIQVIYNFYDIDEINKMSTNDIEDEYKEIFKFPVIINMGSLTKQKGQWHLIRVFKKVKEVIPKMKLVFLGEGELENELKKLVYDLKLEKDVFFLGFQKNPFKFISKAKIFVFPSLYEGFPNAIVEAMTCGIPVISSDCDSGPREILAPNSDIKKKTNCIEYAEYGILIPVCSHKILGAETPLSIKEKIIVNSILKLFLRKDLLNKYISKSKERIKYFEKNNILTKYEKII